jgi:hypothetical protein
MENCFYSLHFIYALISFAAMNFSASSSSSLHGKSTQSILSKACPGLIARFFVL